MTTFKDRITNGLKSGRIRDGHTEPEPVSDFAVIGGWSDTEDPTALPDDPAAAEKTARQAGLAAMVELEAQRQERVKAERDAQLAGIPAHRRGRDYSKGLYG
jgi:hypothetical protein